MQQEIKERRLSEFDFYCGMEILKDDLLYVAGCRRKAFAANPYIEEDDPVFQWVGFLDGKPAGFNCIMPIRINMDGRELRSTTGSSLNVEPWARKSNLGLILPAKGVELMGKDGIAIAASCSQMAIPVHRINGYKYFFMPRYIALWKSRSVVEMKLNGIVGKVVSSLIDVVIGVYAICLSVLRFVKLRGYVVEEVNAVDDVTLNDIATMISLDGHRFREHHDVKWFKWHMTNSFSDNGPCKVRVVRKAEDGEVVAFVMYKRRFHEQASSRGFKNVWLGSIIEWEALKGHEDGLRGLILDVVLDIRKKCDAVELATDDETIGSFARHLGWRHVGDANVGVKVWKSFSGFGDNAVKEQINWRLRPAMGDNGLS